MGNAGYMVRNELANASLWGAWINGGEVDKRFPVSNAANYRPGKVVRFDRLGACYLYGGAIPGVVPLIDSVAVLNHNLGSSADVYLGHSMNQNGPWTYTRLQVKPERFFQRIGPILAGYFKLDIRKVGNTARPVQIGEFAVGRVEEMPVAFQWGDEVGLDFLNADAGDTEFGVPTIYPLSERRVISGVLQNAMKREAAEKIATLRRELRGRAFPFFFVPDLDGSDVILGRLSSNASRSKSLLPGRYAAQEFTVIEDPWGLTGA